MLLGAAYSAQAGNTSIKANTTTTEDLSDRTFNFRQPGLNLDFMSYTSLALVNDNNSALLDPVILANVSSTVFSIFLKHFVQSAVPSTDNIYIKGTWGTQPRDSVLPSDLGPTLESNSSVYLRNEASATSTNATTVAIISTRVIKLQFNHVAVILSLSLLAFLAATTLLIAFYQKRHRKILPRDINTLGSVLGFIYSSERLLRSAADTYASGLISPQDEKVRMGWFNGGGRRRWGIEIVDEREKQVAELPAVEDVDPARLEPLVRGSGSGSLERGDGGVAESQRPAHVRHTSIDDFHGAYSTMAVRTPPMAVASPPLGSLNVFRYG